MDFDLEIVSRAEIKHQASNILYKLPRYDSDRTMLEDNILVMVVTQANKQALNFPIGGTVDGSHA